LRNLTPHSILRCAALVARGYSFENQGFNGDIQAIVVGTLGTVAVTDPRGRGIARVMNE
jgi:gamma-glutamyltranspeptidase/glutathione hydrolase